MSRNALTGFLLERAAPAAILLVATILGACATPAPESGPVSESMPAPVPMPDVAPAQHVPPPSAPAPPVTLSVTAVGDIMLGTDYPDDRLPAQDQPSLMAAVAPLLRQADITFGNLEGVLLDGGEPEKTCRSPSACYLFRMPTPLAAELAAAGFDVLSLANNHARDFGETGRSNTMQVLDELGIAHSGREGDVASWQVKGVRVAMIAFAPFRGSHDMLDLDAVRSAVARLAAEHDVVIVSAHAGAEGEAAMRIPFAVETYHGENRGDVVAFAHTAVDAGADLVIGHGPHVPRALEVYRDRLIAYSLGNFCTYYGVKITGPNGLAPILNAELDATGRFLGGRIVSAVQRRPEGTILDPDAAAATLMRELSRLDFPAAAVEVAFDGRLVPAVAPSTGAIGARLPVADLSAVGTGAAKAGQVR